MTYDQSRKDHEYLWHYAPAYDMTGGYVDQDDLEKLLESPTKKTAMNCYNNQIVYWFEAGPDDSFGIEAKWKTDPKVREIAERHCCEEDFEYLLSK